ncbi:MAG: glycerophosphodiester phosphodiesterase family protein [Spirochaetota bacterium]|nr:glycerophosphodiester phosphodiesterase family protein [Spirochaetota bacterium]
MILNVGHRGFGIYEIENTLSAFQRAIDFKLDMIECDVRLSKDDELIVFHDRSLKRMSSVGLRVEDLDLDTIKKFHIFNKKKNMEVSFERIPSLREVFELTNNKIHLNIELKSNNKHKDLILVKKVIELVKEYKATSQIIISSFKKDILKSIIEKNDEIRCGYIFHKKVKKKSLFHKAFPIYSIHPYKYLVGKKLIKLAKEHNIKIMPWTVNSNKLMKKLILLKVDGIITNYPLKLSNVLLANKII